MRMWAAALRHARLVGELTTLWAAVSSAVELVLGRSSGETCWVEVMNELTANFQMLEEYCSRLKGPGARICGQLLRPPTSQAQWADHVDEATGRHEVELAERR
jgi:hypothetical protein